MTLMTDEEEANKIGKTFSDTHKIRYCIEFQLEISNNPGIISPTNRSKSLEFTKKGRRTI